MQKILAIDRISIFSLSGCDLRLKFVEMPENNHVVRVFLLDKSGSIGKIISTPLRHLIKHSLARVTTVNIISRKAHLVRVFG